MNKLAPFCAILAVACGSSSSDGLFGTNPSPGGGVSTGGSGGDSSGGRGGAVGGDGGRLAAAGGDGAGGSIGPASGGAGTGGKGSGGIPGGGGAAAAGGTEGGGGAAGAGTVAGAMASCGATECDLASGNQCCFAQSNGQTQASCKASACGFPYTVAVCDGPEDCAAPAVCCGTFQTTPFGVEYYSRLECSIDCTGTTRRNVCHAGASCPVGSCRASPTLPSSYGVCVQG
jgi:hypothetical protein